MLPCNFSMHIYIYCLSSADSFVIYQSDFELEAITSLIEMVMAKLTGVTSDEL